MIQQPLNPLFARLELAIFSKCKMAILLGWWRSPRTQSVFTTPSLRCRSNGLGSSCLCEHAWSRGFQYMEIEKAGETLPCYKRTWASRYQRQLAETKRFLWRFDSCWTFTWENDDRGKNHLILDCGTLCTLKSYLDLSLSTPHVLNHRLARISTCHALPWVQWMRCLLTIGDSTMYLGMPGTGRVSKVIWKR